MTLQCAAHGRTAEALIDPARGGRTIQIRLQPDSCSSPVPLLDNDPGTEGFSGQILLPFNDRIPRGVYQWEGREFRLPVNAPNGTDALHGFLYRLPMKIARSPEPSPESSESSDNTGHRKSHAADDNEAELELQTEIIPNTSTGYPFHLIVRLSYRLGLDRFEMDIEVTNSGQSPAPLAFGWHPYFRLPLSETIDDYSLRIPSDYYVEVDSRLIPTGETPKVDGSRYDFRKESRVGTTEMDVAIHKTADPLILSNGRYTLELRSSEIFSYRQVFTPPNRRSIAVEPVTAATDSFNRPSLGLRRIEAGETIRGTVALRV